MTAVAAPTSRRPMRGVAAVLAVVAALLLIGFLTSNHKTNFTYDLESTSPQGSKAFADLVSGLGADVRLADRFPPDADIALLFDDVVPSARVSDVNAWVRSGRTLVVTDPYSDFTPRRRSVADVGRDPRNLGQGRCTINALAGVKELHPGPTSFAEARFEPNSGDAVCFADADGAFITLTPVGEGQIVSIASGAMFTNRYLGEADNAALAASLFAPRPGTRVAVLSSAAFVGGSDSPGAPVDIMGSTGRLITPGVQLFLFQLLVALAVYGLARGRRLGRPVLEPQPVQIAGSELVSAVGNLMQQSRQPAVAGAVLRADLRRVLSDRLGVPPSAPPEVLADIVAARTRLDRDTVLPTLIDRPVATERELVELAHQIDIVREEVLHGNAP